MMNFDKYDLCPITLGTLLEKLRLEMTNNYSKEDFAIEVDGKKCYISASIASLSYVVKEFPSFEAFEKYFKENGYCAYVCTKEGFNAMMPYNEVFLINDHHVIQLAKGGGYAFSAVYNLEDFEANGPLKLFEKRNDVRFFAPLKGQRLLTLL